MDEDDGRRGPGRRTAVVVGVVAAAAVGAAVVWATAGPRSEPELPGGAWTPPAASATTGPATGATDDPPYLTAVDDGGRYFVDQSGDPFLVKGESPWSLLLDLSPEQAQDYLEARAGQGFNTLIVSLVGAPLNGGPSEDGATYDGVLPFVDGDVLDWDEEYWSRAHDTLRAAADLGLTVMLYPIDGWTIGNAFSPSSPDQCVEFGARVARWAEDLPNIAWVTGGDYVSDPDDPAGSTSDRCMGGMLDGIRSTGDERPFSIQFVGGVLSTENDYWRDRVDWNFVYTYEATYSDVGDAYETVPARPALLSESNYEGENNTGGRPTTDETLRRQVLWAVTAGSPGDIMGTDDWEFLDGWQDRLDSEGVAQVSRLRAVVEDLDWWELVPRTGDSFLLEGAGPELPDSDGLVDMLDDDHATAAVSPDGDLALVYLPSGRDVALDLDALADGVEARWVDPASGASHAVDLTERMTTPGRNVGGQDDWLLVIEAP